MKVIYVAGAYRASTLRGILENIRKAEELAMEVWKADHVALCPHLNTRLMDGIVPDQNFLDGDIEMLKRCDGIIMVPGWSISTGAVKELRVAQRLGIPRLEIEDIKKL